MKHGFFLSGSLAFGLVGSALAIGPPHVVTSGGGSQAGPPLVDANAMESPVRVAFGDGDVLYVSDEAALRIRIMDDRRMRLTGSFSVPGRPTALAFDGQHLYVGNETAGRVDLYDTAGQFIRVFASDIAQPNDIAIDTQLERVFVVCSQQHLVKVFDYDGVQTGEIPAAGQEQLPNPTAVAIFHDPSTGDLDGDGDVDRSDVELFLRNYGSSTSRGDLDGDGDSDPADFLKIMQDFDDDPPPIEVYVSDFGELSDEPNTLGPAVRVYTTQGEHLRTIEGDFSRPQGLATNGRGHLFLADGLRCEVLVFDQATGDFIALLEDLVGKEDRLLLPLDVVIDQGNGDVFITNNRLGRIEVMRGAGNLP
jgi:sugar lactone lactonase YvrE